MNVRQLAAVDLHGAYGRPWRRWVIVAEFLAGATAGVALGLWTAAAATGPTRLFGLWIAGVGLNYWPLSAHALDLVRPGRLDPELEGVDIADALRHYTTRQLWVAVPLLLWFWAARPGPRL